MTNAIISDLTGKTLKADQSYKVSVYSRGQKVHMDIDCEFVSELRDILLLARQNGVEWYKLEKNEDGRWERINADFVIPQKKGKVSEDD